MPVQKVWHEEIQSWVFEDPADVDILDLGYFDIFQFDLSLATLPLHILEGKYLHKKEHVNE